MSDLISIQDAIDALHVEEELLKRVLDDMDVVAQDREKYSWGLGLIESYISDIEELPSAEPVRHGKWKQTYLDHEAFGERPSIFYCSACCACSNVKTNYCSNCGARMDKE